MVINCQKTKKQKTLNICEKSNKVYDTPEEFKASLFCDNFTDWVLDSIWDD